MPWYLNPLDHFADIQTIMPSSPLPELPPDLIARLRCPIERQPLQLLTPEQVSRVNQSIQSGAARDRLDSTVTQPIEGGLMTESQSWVYPIRSGIPTLVADEAIRFV